MHEREQGAPRNGGKAPMDVFAIIERANSEKAYWLKIGSAFVNRDLSINVVLDAVPLNGSKLQIRERDDDHDRRQDRRGNGAGAAPPA